MLQINLILSLIYMGVCFYNRSFSEVIISIALVSQCCGAILREKELERAQKLLKEVRNVLSTYLAVNGSE